MNRYLIALAAVAFLFAAPPAFAAKLPGNLTVYDDGNLFTAGAIEKAKAALSGTQFDGGLKMTIDTYKEIPEAKKAGYNEANKAAFFQNWVESLATEDRAKGIYVLICRHPGYVAVIADRQTRDRGFTNEQRRKLQDTLGKSLADAAKHKDDAAKQAEIRDAGLRAAVDDTASALKNTTTVARGPANRDPANRQGVGLAGAIPGLICVGLVGLLVVWMVIGVFRSFTRGSGGGGYGPGGGGGGGGFLTSLLGGMFGAAAGMWMYNNFFGGGSHGGMFGGSNDSYTGGGSHGAGDFSGDGGGDGGGDWGGGFDGGGFDGGGDF